MRRFSLGLSFGFVSFVILGTFLLDTQLAHATAVGATPGSFSVDPNGGATYTIPIVAPPGTAGMAPSIALTYSKSVDNPLVGVGFSISGLSIIHRCGKTIAVDGQKGGVNYDSNDRFCLDGQRLIAVQGAYGANGTEYRTEREGFNKIFSYRESTFTGIGPQYFLVKTKDGATMEYGGNATVTDGRIEAAPKNGVTQTTVRLWALNKVQDIKGNYYTVTYTENSTNGEYRPDRIDYTGNTTASLTPYNSIRFNYTARNDVIEHYQAGSQIKVTQRLTKVESYADSVMVRMHSLAYDNAGPANHSRLISVQECGSDAVCLPATVLTWSQDGQFSGTDVSWGLRAQSLENDGKGIRYADVNGDGLPDLVYDSDSNGNYIRVLLNTGSGFGSDNNWGKRTKGYKGGAGGFRLVDMNGDGLPDFVYDAGSNGIRVLLNTGSGFGPDSKWGSHSNGYNDNAGGFQLTDINGDGFADFVYDAESEMVVSDDGSSLIMLEGGIHVLLNSGMSLGAETKWGARAKGYKAGAGGFRLADMNGDGLPDFVYDSKDGNGIRVLLNTGTSYGTDSSWGGA